MQLLQLLVLVVALALGSEAACASYPSGLTKWSTVSGWMTSGASVTVAADQKILLDVSPPALKSVTIAGTVYVDDANIQLTTSWIKVLNGGSLYVGIQACPITQKVIFEFTGARQPASQSDMGTDPFDGETLGSKGIAILTGGTFLVYGQWQGPAWTNLKAIATSGTSTLRLKERIYWKAGDTLIVTSTDFSATVLTPTDGSLGWMGSRDGKADPDQTEVVTISSVDSTGTVITLTKPLAYTHWADHYQYAEVGLLTRRVVFRGDQDSLSSEYGGHLMMRKAKKIEIWGAEFYRFGQRAVLGRYPIHFHFIHDAQGLGYIVAQTSSYNQFSRALTIHESYGITIRDMVAYNCWGHLYFLETGGEFANTFDHNLGATARAVGNSETGYGGLKLQLINSDNSPSIFWITNPDNIYTNNAAVGGKHGFWYGLPDRVLTTKAQAFHDPNYSPSHQPVRGFSGNTAHSVGESGVLIDHGPDANDMITGGNPYWGRGNGVFRKATVYKCRGVGVWAITDAPQYGHIIVDSKDRALFYNGYTSIIDSIFVGRSGNVGITSAYKDMNLATGIMTYDVGTSSHSINNIFINYTIQSDYYNRKAGAHAGQGSALRPQSKIINATYINCNRISNTWINDGKGSFVWHDTDATTTGVKGGAIVISGPHSIALPSPSTGCVRVADYSGNVCLPTFDTHFQLTIIDSTTPRSYGEYSATLLDGSIVKANGATRWTFKDARNASLSGSIWGAGDGSQCDPRTGGDCEAVFFNMPVRRVVSVKFTFNTQYRASPSKFWIQAGAVNPGEWIITSYPYPTSATFVIVDTDGVTWTRVSSYNDIDHGKYFYDSNTELLWVMIRGRAEFSPEIMQFSKYQYIDSDSTKVIITVTCPNNRCSPTASKLANTYAPPGLNSSPWPNVVNKINTYTGTFRNCLVRPATSASSGVGQVQITHSPIWNELHITGFHDLSAINPKVRLGVQNSDGTTTFINFPVVSTSPFKGGSIGVSPAIGSALYSGKVFVQVSSDSYPNGHIRANLYCKGSCSAPSYVVEAVTCPYGTSTSAKALMVFANGATQNGFNIGLYDPNGNSKYATTSEQKCGGNTLSVAIGFAGEFQFNMNNLQVTSAKYNFLEMYVKCPSGTASCNSGIYLRTQSTFWSTGLKLATYAINGIINDFDGWQLVSIPLADFKLGSNFDNLQNIIFKDDFQPFQLDNIKLTFSKGALVAPGTKTEITPCAYGVSATQSQAIMIFSNGATQNGFNLGLYNPMSNSGYTTVSDTRCGGNSIQMSLGYAGEFQINMNNMQVTSAKYNFLEMYVKCPSGTSSCNSNVYLRTQSTFWSTAVRLSNYGLNVKNGAFGNSWQLVSIPLVDFKIGANIDNLQTIIFKDDWFPILFDNIKFTYAKAAISTAAGSSQLTLGTKPANECPSTAGGAGPSGEDSEASPVVDPTTPPTDAPDTNTTTTPDAVKNSAGQTSPSLFFLSACAVAFVAALL